MRNTKIGAWFVLFGLSFAMFGCGTITLDPEGVYKGDVVLYRADSSITTAKKAVSEFLAFEKANRSFLEEKLPVVVEAAKTIRIEAKEWFRKAVDAREMYAAAQTQTNAEGLNDALDVLTNVLDQIAIYLAQHNQSKNAQNEGVER